MQILFNADDFGLSSGVNQGIITAFTAGVVRSTTLLTNLGATTLEAIALAKENPNLSVGIHLNAFLGMSLTGFIAGCTDETGHFYKWIQNPNATPVHPVDWDALKNELEAQIRFALDHGIQPTHLDSHRHAHAHPQLAPIVVELAQQYQLPIRNYRLPAEAADYALTDAFSPYFYDHTVNLTALETLIATTDASSLEIMCHPAVIDDTLQTRSSYTTPREKELHLLTSEALKTWLAHNHHTLLTIQPRSFQK